MDIAEIRIHPAIGVARVGNSAKEFFVGPERKWDRSAPEDGKYKTDGRIKRQVARFRLFAYDQHEVPTEVVAGPGVEIEWTVHLVNAKAAARKFDPASTRNSGYSDAELDDLVIDPGPRSVGGTGEEEFFDDGEFTLRGHRPEKVRLGEIRTDESGRLLVFGGLGAARSPSGMPLAPTGDSDGWYDDISDGPVTAKVKIAGQEHTAAGAWVIVAPPKFAPPVIHAVRLWDKMLEALAPPPASAPHSYVEDIYPIVQAAMDAGGVNAQAHATERDGKTRPHHVFQHPVVGPAQAVIARLVAQRGGAGHMPKLRSDAEKADLDLPLTPTQKGMIAKWARGDAGIEPEWNADWFDGPRVSDRVTPDGMDKAALENCVGGPLCPGFEAGELLLRPERYEPIRLAGGQPSFRLSHGAVEPGEVTASMALPWQADVEACDSFWWPGARPNQVRVTGSPATAPREPWNRAFNRPMFVAGGWAKMGFVTRQQEEGLVETESDPENR
ncbi:Lysine-epsilon oxidase (EC antimicrobial protein LodA [Amycolatopsis camponoti]|uniref:Lysine-epsilon oxidase n=1 Tax=Amycolatopsis camponoti TaxID=2606593 RepID=A0A6I8M4G6_9PSEU|nr:LodA/GoxA family CTQ-dependent oxidase [Amycolatopsis camponoti]VVJ24861.1 Lysine-epsilon oxidase (EC antimicrobial protein LodA [Amycolatopsis camponoti]